MLLRIDWICQFFFFFFSSRRRHTRLQGDWSSDVCSSDLASVGFRKVLRATSGRLIVFSAEIMNEQRNRAALEIGIGPVYTTNPPLAQGHTERGQILGSDVGLDGTGATLAVDWYSPRGRWSVRWTRVLLADRGDFFSTGQIDPRARDVQHALV